MSKHIVYCFNMQSLFVQLHKKVEIRTGISGPELAG